MDIIDVTLFVQSFIWASLLIKQPKKKSRYLGLAFLLNSFIYILIYAATLNEISYPDYLIPFLVKGVALLLSFFQIRNSPVLSTKRVYAAMGLLASLAALFCVFGILGKSEGFSIWSYTLLYVLITLVADAYLLLKPYLKKTHIGSLMEDPPYRLGYVFLLDKALILLFASFILLFPFESVGNSTTVVDSFHLMLMVLVFVSGYVAVTGSPGGTLPGKRIKSSKQSDLEFIERLNHIMQDQKPYLDCELSLEKMASILETSMYELTRILNHEMDISFYKLINDYRMETVLNKLNEPDNRKFTIMASAYESGFNSKSTFYRIFKEYTRMTPKEYILKHHTS